MVVSRLEGCLVHLAVVIVLDGQFCVVESSMVSSLLCVCTGVRVDRRVGADEGGSDAKPDSPTKPETTSKGIPLLYQLYQVWHCMSLIIDHSQCTFTLYVISVARLPKSKIRLK